MRSVSTSCSRPARRWMPALSALASICITVMPAAARATSAGEGLVGHRGWIAPAASVNLFSTATRAVPPSGRIRQLPVGLPVPQSTIPLLTQVASFPLLSHDQQVSALGGSKDLEPPDTMVAAGPTSLLEIINSSASVWTKSGTRTALVDMNKALPMPTGFSFGAPWELFDASSGRFFFSGVGSDPAFNSVVFLGVSRTNNPTGGFFIYKVAQTSTGELHFGPKLGVNVDKVVISWNEMCCGPTGTFIGAETVVFEKATLLAGAATPMFAVGPTLSESSPVPAQSLSSTTTEYVTFNGGSFAGVLAITGRPALGNVVVTETDLPMPATSVPPKAMQPGGTIATGDNRFLSSTWQKGLLWVSGNTGCTPPGSATVRACMRLVEVSTTGLAPTLMQAFDVGKSGIDAYYPAVTLDIGGDLFASFSVSNASVFPAAAAFEIAAGAAPGTITAAAVFQPGAQKYGGMTWGAYSAISVDPVTSRIWAAAEYSAAGSLRDWGTAVGEFSLGGGAANGSWTTYHRDDGHTGYDPLAPAVGTVSPTPGWTETTLDAEVYAEPLVYNRLVYAATLNNTVYALNQSTGAVVWQKNVGVPVSSGWQCGNVSPQGILGTPVIDPAAGRIYVATILASDHLYRVFGLDLATGAVVMTTVIPAAIGTGFDWTIQQERGALAVANGYVYVPFGGRAGDCGSYHGWVVGVPVNGSTSLNVYETPDTGSGVWTAGGVVVDDTTGDVFVTTGNGVVTGCGSVNQNDAVVRLSPTLALQDYFMPQDWQANWCNNDQDLGSASPLLISPSLLFQAGKWGNGFLLDPANLGQVDGQLFPTPKPATYAGADVCLGNHSDATFGSFAYARPFVYLECDGHGLVALNVDTSVPAFTACGTVCPAPDWQAGGSNTFGPPIVAGGVVWVAGNNGLYGFNATTGAQVYHSATFGTNRFVTPAEAGGQVFVPSHLVIKSFTFG